VAPRPLGAAAITPSNIIDLSHNKTRAPEAERFRLTILRAENHIMSAEGAVDTLLALGEVADSDPLSYLVAQLRDHLTDLRHHLYPRERLSGSAGHGGRKC